MRKNLSLQSKKSLTNLPIFIAFAIFLLSVILPKLFYFGEYQWHVITIGQKPLLFELQFTPLSHMLLIYVAFVNLFITRFTTTYLSFESCNVKIVSNLLFLLSTIFLFILSDSILTSFVAWALMSLALNRLLAHYSDSTAAQQAAKQQLFMCHLGDGAFLMATILSFYWYGTSRFDSVFSHSDSFGACLILWILVVGALIKCAQFPFHQWLLKTMEAPTPFSAMLHAGVINAGGIFLAKISTYLISHHQLMLLIALWGAITAIIGKIWLNFQADIKSELAYSTKAQVGYMFFQCGLGCFGSALFHLMAHGLFKAYLFLNAGSALHQRHNIPNRQNAALPRLKAILLTCIVTAVTILAGHQIYLSLTNTMMHPFITLFSAITLGSFINYIFKNTDSIRYAILAIAFFCISFIGYILLLSFFIHLLPASVIDYPGSAYITTSHILLVVTAALYFFWHFLPTHKKNQFARSLFKLSLNSNGILLEKKLWLTQYCHQLSRTCLKNKIFVLS